LKQSLKVFLAVVITFILTVTFMLIGFNIIMENAPMINVFKANKIIESLYIGEYDAKEAEKAAINAIVANTGDKYGVFYDGEEAGQMMDLFEGNYVGIGIEIVANKEKNRIEVVSAYEESPAFKAGIKSGDLIISIDGREYTADEMSEAATYMRGNSENKDKDENVVMVIKRGEKNFTAKMKREKIALYRVRRKMTDDGVFYIRYNGFTKQSEKALEKAVEEAETLGAKALVIDVRDNPGGDFDSAVSMCDLFLDDGMIMYTVDKNGEKETFTAKKGGTDLKLAVLVNEASASAAEIFAASMQARKRAVIVGEKTYGKGVCQTLSYLNPLNEEGGLLKITSCKNFAPDGKWINEAVTPDVIVKAEPDYNEPENDAVFIKAVEKLMEKE